MLCPNPNTQVNLSPTPSGSVLLTSKRYIREPTHSHKIINRIGSFFFFFLPVFVIFFGQSVFV